MATGTAGAFGFALAEILCGMEKVKKPKNAQLARELEVALPIELSEEQNLTLVRE